MRIPPSVWITLCAHSSRFLWLYNLASTIPLARLLSRGAVLPFQAKLGWLTGNLYSRVGTEDWAPDNVSDAQFAEMVDDLLKRQCVWVDRKKHAVLLARLTEAPPNRELTQEDVETILSAIPVESSIDTALSRIKEVALCNQDTAAIAQAPEFQNLLKILRNDPLFAGVLKR